MHTCSNCGEYKSATLCEVHHDDGIYVEYVCEECMDYYDTEGIDYYVEGY